MRRALSLFLGMVFLALSITACGGKNGSGSAPEKKTADTAEMNTTDKEISRPVLERSIMEKRGGNVAYGNRQVLRLTGESRQQYPELSAALNGFMDNRASDVNNEMLFIRRADNEALSLLIFDYSDSEGAHGNYGYSSINLDSATGKTLTIKDIIDDTDRLGQRIKEELSDKYGRDAFYEEMEETVDQEIRGENGYELTWTLDPQGISFYFNPYEIGPYVSGVQSVCLLYDWEHDLFNGRYLPEEEGYISEIPTNLDCCIDVDRDGKTECLEVAYSEDDTGAVSGLMIAVNDRELSRDDFFCWSMASKLVYAPNGKIYLYVWRDMDYGYVSMDIFDLSDGTPVSVGDMNLSEPCYFSLENIDIDTYQLALTDPGNMFLSTQFMLIKDYYAGRTYRLSDTPYPVSEEKYYVLTDDFTLTSRKNVKADIVDESGNVTESAQNIPSGSIFKLYRTDGGDIVDALLEDGRIVRLTVKGEESQTVNGIKAEDLFESPFD